LGWKRVTERKRGCEWRRRRGWGGGAGGEGGGEEEESEREEIERKGWSRRRRGRRRRGSGGRGEKEKRDATFCEGMRGNMFVKRMKCGWPFFCGRGEGT
jgi:hypothetical protein